MTTFYKVLGPENELAWIAAIRDEQRNQIVVWVTDTAQWHHHVMLESDYYSLGPFEPFMHFVEVHADEVDQLLENVPSIVGTFSEQYLRDAKTCSSEELGLGKTPILA